MNVSLALFHACKSFKPDNPSLGTGISAVARLINMSPDVLQKKLSPTCDTHHLTAEDLEAITEAGVLAGAIELARAGGLACVPMPGAGVGGSLMKGMSEISREFSELLVAFDDAIGDNQVTPNECDAFQREAIQLFAETMAELGRMRALAATRGQVVPFAPTKQTA